MHYRCLGVRFEPATDGVRITSTVTGRSSVIGPIQAALLASCTRFDRPAEHAERGYTKLFPILSRPAEGWSPNSLQDAGDVSGSPEIASIEVLLRSFSDEGFLISREEAVRCITRHLRPQEVHTSPAPVTVLGIPTRNRPVNLERALQTYGENLARYGRTATIVVADDSDDKSVKERNHCLTGRLQNQFGLETRYIDPAGRRAFADRIAARAGVETDLVRFALDAPVEVGTRYGVNRNLLILKGAGHKMVMVDDDTVCRLSTPSCSHPGLQLVSSGDPNELWFDETGNRLESDFLGIHEEMLGNSLERLLSHETASSVDIERMSEPLFESLCTGHCRVGISMTGITGDPGMDHSLEYVFLEGMSRDRLLQSGRSFRDAVFGKKVIRSPCTNTLTDNPFCMTTAIGLDLRTNLPPFMPVGPSEDALFGALLSFGGPGLLKGLAPITVEHTRPEVRAKAAVTELKPRAIGTNYLITWMMAVTEPRTGNRAEFDFERTGDWFIDLGRRSSSDLLSEIHQTCTRVATAQIEWLECSLCKNECPENWKADIVRFMRFRRAMMDHPDAWIPVDLPGNRDEKLSVFSDVLSRFGRLLQAWPAILDAAPEWR